MLKKATVCILAVVVALLSPVGVFAETTNSIVEQGGNEIVLYYQTVSMIDVKLSFSGATAKSRISITPGNGIVIDKVAVNAKLMKTGNSTPVKTWSETLYPDILEEFNFVGTHKVASKGTYYVVATIKCYRGTTLLETIQVESKQVTY